MKYLAHQEILKEIHKHNTLQKLEKQRISESVGQTNELILHSAMNFIIVKTKRVGKQSENIYLCSEFAPKRSNLAWDNWNPSWIWDYPTVLRKE